jgi:hypothetical protein
MNADILVQILFFIILATTAWYCFFWLYREHTVDNFRQRLFALRDQLFDEAAAGTISFDHPAYQMMRLTMNGFIRFGHRISLFELFIRFVIIKHKSADSYVSRFNESIKDLDYKTADKMRQYQSRMVDLVVMQTLAASPVFLIFVISYLVPTSLFMWLKKVTLSTLSSILSQPIDSMESTALAYGQA